MTSTEPTVADVIRQIADQPHMDDDTLAEIVTVYLRYGDTSVARIADFLDPMWRLGDEKISRVRQSWAVNTAALIRDALRSHVNNRSPLGDDSPVPHA